jgi:signal transduction histidine kinase/ActR/RegA family two-component response regulator
LRLAVFIHDKMELILQEWEKFARTMEPAAGPMTSKELRDHAAVMLASIADDLNTAQSSAQGVTEPRGSQLKAGEEHGLARLESDFTIEQLVAEYRALRSSVLRLWREETGDSSSGDIDDIIHFNEAIDQLLASSVIIFAKTTRDAIEAEKRHKDQFLAMLAHELRNPLSPISAAATLLKMSKSNEKVIAHASGIIARQVAHMATLIDDLLDVSRVTRGTIELKLESVDLRDVISSAVEQVLPQMESRQHVLTVPTMRQAILVHGDKKRLVQVMANLLTNAAKYTLDHGKIALKLDVQGNRVEVTVEDNGIGMEVEFMPHVFDLFAQAERSSDRTSGGLGLGLALVKSVTELHHGKVTCKSSGLGKGSQFSICLPKLASEKEQIERRQTPRNNSHGAEALKIMVVDDNIDAAAVLAMLLETTGHQVIVANTASDALRRSKTEVPNVFVLDIGLPDFDGNKLAKYLRDQSETTDAVLIALTGYGMQEDCERSIEAGFDHHLVKPVDTKKLEMILAKIHPAKGL